MANVDPVTIKSEIDNAIKSSPPGRPRFNTAASIRTILKRLIDWVVSQNYTPDHSWVGTAIRFVRADGTPGSLVDLKGSKGEPGFQGWSPIVANVVDGLRIVQQVTDWVGGAGNKPAVVPALYVSPTGYTAIIANATNVRGGLGVNWRDPSAWAANTQYYANDGVTNGGNSYRRKSDGVSGSSFDPTQWDLIAQGGGVADGSVTLAKLTPTISSLINTRTDASADWVYSITDTNNRVVFGIKADGSCWVNLTGNQIATNHLLDGSVTVAKLSQAVKDFFPVTLETRDSGWAWAVIDSNGRIALGIRSDGTVYAAGISALTDGSVSYAKVDDTIKTLLPWYGKKALCIGDSVTAALGYQTTLAARTGLTITTHAKGGIGLVQMVDGDGAQTSPIAALTADQLADKDIVTVFGCLNDRASLVGTRADMYPSQSTIYGKMNYVITKINNLAASAGRKDIRIVLIVPHKVGKYNYVDADGGQEYPAGSGQTLETIVAAIKDIGGFYGLPVIDLYHHSGINNFNWDTLTVNTTSASGPYPNNPDNVHPNAAGHSRLGRYIAKVINNL